MAAIYMSLQDPITWNSIIYTTGFVKNMLRDIYLNYSSCSEKSTKHNGGVR
jgi:hypothetical protein